MYTRLQPKRKCGKKKQPKGQFMRQGTVAKSIPRHDSQLGQQIHNCMSSCLPSLFHNWQETEALPQQPTRNYALQREPFIP